MMNPGLQYPIFGPEIKCPHCQKKIPALILTDTYLCSRHGAFEAHPQTGDLIHLQSGRHWCKWNDEWYRQHTHPDGVRFEIHEALDNLYTQGYRATRVVIAKRYQILMGSSLEEHTSWCSGQLKTPAVILYGLPVEFSPDASEEPCWGVINFNLDTEPGVPVHYPYFRLLE